jgi:endoglucanase
MNNLNKYFSFFLIIFIVILPSSCKSESVVLPELVVSKEEVAFSKENGTIILSITSNMQWKAISSESWCTLSPASGVAGSRQVDISVTENTLSMSREAVITITSGSVSKTVKVLQTRNVLK